MSSDEIRDGIRAFMALRGIKVSSWCRRAGIDDAAIYAYLAGKTNDIGASKLVALAQAENVPIDVMIGRSVYAEKQLLDQIIPIVQQKGTDLSLKDLAHEAGVRLFELQTEWTSVSDVIVSAYLHAFELAVPSIVKDASGMPVLKALSEMETCAAAWVIDRYRFFLAFRASVVTSSDRQREKYRDIRLLMIHEVKNKILNQASDLLPMTDEMKEDLAEILITLSDRNLTWYCKTGDPELVARKFIRLVKIVLSGKILK